MSDRRRAPRYVLDSPLRGQARPMQDAVVEHFFGDRLVVIAPSSRRPSEELRVHLAMPAGTTSYTAQVIDSSPVSVEGIVSFRLELRVRPVAEARDRESA